MLKVVLVEDSEEAKNTVETYLDKYSKESGLQYRLIWFDNPINFLTKYSPEYDIILLDIQLPDMNGMDVAHKVREIDENIPIIFITNMAQFAIKGYEVSAADFMVKPVTYFDFATKFGRVLKRREKKDDLKISVSNGADGVKYISVREVSHVEVLKHKLKYYTASGVYEVAGSLVKAQSVLEEYDFARCNNYCLANLSHVFGVKGYVLTVLTGKGNEKTELMISQPRKKEFMQKLNDYFRRHA